LAGQYKGYPACKTLLQLPKALFWEPSIKSQYN